MNKCDINIAEYRKRAALRRGIIKRVLFAYLAASLALDLASIAFFFNQGFGK